MAFFFLLNTNSFDRIHPYSQTSRFNSFVFPLFRIVRGYISDSFGMLGTIKNIVPTDQQLTGVWPSFKLACKNKIVMVFTNQYM